MLNSGTTTVEPSKFLYGMSRALVCDEYLVGASAPVSKVCSPPQEDGDAIGAVWSLMSLLQVV